MKATISTFFLLFFSFFPLAQVKWMTLEEALQAQKLNPKKILIEFYTPKNEACKNMEQFTFTHEVIIQNINDFFYAVRFDAEDKKPYRFKENTFTNPSAQKNNSAGSLHDFAKYMSVFSVPSILFLDEETKPITTLNGNFSAKDLEPYLSFFSSGKISKISEKKDWEAYQRKFKSKIRE